VIIMWGYDVDIESRGPSTYTPVHLVNINIQDNLDEATFGSFLFCELCEMLSQAEDLDNEFELILQEFEIKHSSKAILHSVLFCWLLFVLLICQLYFLYVIQFSLYPSIVYKIL
jgi:hypothetical protein